MKVIEYKVVIQKNEEGEEGYWAYCPELPGCNSTGNMLKEVKENIEEAIKGYIEVLKSLNKSIPMPSKDSLIIDNISVEV